MPAVELYLTVVEIGVEILARLLKGGGLLQQAIDLGVSAPQLVQESHSFALPGHRSAEMPPEGRGFDCAILGGIRSWHRRVLSNRKLDWRGFLNEAD